MKYFKFAQISAESGISWAIEQPISGPSMPPLPGLTDVEQLDQNYYVGTTDDSAVAVPENHIFEITFSEYAQHLKDKVLSVSREWLSDCYKQEIDLRNLVFGKYHDTASVAGIYKYEEAKALVADSTATATNVRAEATLRGVDPVVLANRIITNHEDFRIKESNIAGVRGKVVDRLTAFTFDLTDPKTSFTEFFSVEVIGTEPGFVYSQEEGRFVSGTVDVKVGKYSPSLATRYVNI